ncbi:MAG TPA: YihY family inner membrane protein [Limnobacter sp.]|uniref:YihY family inner membrane protein n=1 Tax=Limnobacter sp. TaxID=2003368 RepID=UPI002ED7DBC1
MTAALPKPPTELKSLDKKKTGFIGAARMALLAKKAELTPVNPAWWVAFTRLVWSRIKYQNLPQVAASLTFTTVLSLVPMITVALAIFTAFPMFERMQTSLQSYMLESFFPENIADTILTYVNQFSAKAKGLSAVGTLFLVLTALTTMFTVDRVFNQIWNVKRPRTLANKVVLYWTVISFSPVLIGFSLSLSTAVIGQNLKGIDSSQGGWLPVLSLVSMLVTAVAFAFIYRVVPNRAVHWKDALAGGVVASVLFEVTKRAFAAYITHFPSYTAVYGALAAFPIFLLWIYVSWIIVLLGASTAAALPVARTGCWDNAVRPGQDWYQGLAVLAELEKSRQQALPGMTLEELRVFTKVPPDQLDHILSALIQHGVVGPLANSRGSERFALICDPARISAAVVVKALWLDTTLNDDYAERLPQGTARMMKLQSEFIDRPRLADWLENPDT